MMKPRVAVYAGRLGVTLGDCALPVRGCTHLSGMRPSPLNGTLHWRRGWPQGRIAASSTRGVLYHW
jgi:hypothetical protein